MFNYICTCLHIILHNYNRFVYLVKANACMEYVYLVPGGIGDRSCCPFRSPQQFPSALLLLRLLFYYCYNYVIVIIVIIVFAVISVLFSPFSTMFAHVRLSDVLSLFSPSSPLVPRSDYYNVSVMLSCNQAK